MRDVPTMVGLEISTILRFQKVPVRFRASATGSPSVPADAG